MAISKTHSLVFLLFLLFSLKTQARAVRESHFFNKATRDDTIPIEPQSLVDKQQLPNPKQEDPTTTTTTTTYQQSQNGYGLYANSYNNNQYSPSTTTTNQEYENARDLPAKYSTEEYTQGKTYETQLVDKPYGMSDTRFLENGRYYYDINAEKNQNRYASTRDNYMGYRSTKVNNNYRGYYEPSKRVDSVNNRYNNNYGGSYYGNNENTFETEEDDFEP
ncbi:hypothetical protein MRB53_035765 [Persea americana]|uniref:Uncharacterized protein n=1 Tax=Persea americana TaxID=3435 RepID=A0ACC2K657_PERAE|nr:hypothetical protein MRB53_035765 [Persea americana]